MAQSFSVNGILRDYGKEYRKKRPFLPEHERKIMASIESCRTEKLGGRIEICEECGHVVKTFHSCRNRHCPQCQFLKKEEWISRKKHQVFPFQYFHAVFTLPHQLIPLEMRNRRRIYDLLFQSVRNTLLSVSQEKKYFGANIGFFAILHTWGQNLNLHPHLHCVIPGGGVIGQKWVKSPKGFLLPIPVLKKRFRSLFLVALKKLYQTGDLDTAGTPFTDRRQFQDLIDTLFKTDWVVYLKESFRNPDSVIEYLGRYTHRIAISNHRILAVEDDAVTFQWKDYASGNKKRAMTISADEFLRRFLLHVVPPRYVRIRYYGIMANRNHRKNRNLCRQFYQMEEEEEPPAETWEDIMEKVTGKDPRVCPHCQKGRLRLSAEIPSRRDRSPPERGRQIC